MRRAAKWSLLTLLIAAIAIAVAGPYLKRTLEERLRREIEARAAKVTGGRVSIGRLEISLAPAALRLREIGLARSGNRGSEAQGTIERIEIRAGVLTFLRLRQGAFDVTADRPRLDLVLAEGRPIATPGGGEGAPVALLTLIPIGSSLTLREGEIGAAYANGPRMRVIGLRLEARHGPSAGAVHGHAEWS